MLWEVTTRTVLQADTEEDACEQVRRALEPTGWDIYLVDSVAGEDDEEFAS